MPQHAHRHFPEIQVYTSKKRDFDLLELNPGKRINIAVADDNRDFVAIHPSYTDHCPRLAKILADADDGEFRKQRWHDIDEDYVRARITVNRGTIRVKEVVSWDAGAFPLGEDPAGGFRSATPAVVSFLGSAIQGHMASECVIDIPSASRVEIRDDSKPKPTSHVGVRPGNPRVAGGDVEVLVTNFPSQQERALPWSVHFLWLFRAGGYTPLPIPGELKDFERLAREYLARAIRNDDPDAKERAIQEVIDHEFKMLGADRVGFPIPYLDPSEALTRLEPIGVRAPLLADPWYLPLCPQGDNTKSLGGG